MAGDAASRIRAMITETEADQARYRATGDRIYAAACAIRLVALRQALKAVEDGR